MFRVVQTLREDENYKNFVLYHPSIDKNKGVESSLNLYPPPPRGGCTNITAYSYTYQNKKQDLTNKKVERRVTYLVHFIDIDA